MILVIDNYDSFVHNLARYVTQLTNVEVSVVRNDKISPSDIDPDRISAMVISPGPCGPAHAGQSVEIIRHHHRSIPILGVCLGHQAIVVALGGTVTKSGRPFHGKSSQVFHRGNSNLFKNIPSPFDAGRYHSLRIEADNLPDSLQPTAHTVDNVIMAIEHVEFPCFGVQFHPESVLTPFGYEILNNFLTAARIETRPQSTKVTQ